jgi:hypothetical protein
MKYTKFQSSDDLVESYLKIITEEIKNNCPGLKAIILAGGYGRGEGAVEFVKKKPRLLNDLDLYLITEKQLSDSFLEKLGKRCSELIGKGGLEFPENYRAKFDFDTFFNVDLRCITFNRLKHLPPTVRYYEMKNGTIILYGEDVRKLIPEIKTEDLPFSEGLRFLSNRMMNMFLSMKEEYLKEKPSNDEIGIINYYICKAYLACCDSLLLSVGKFAPSYEGRVNIFREIYKETFPELNKKFSNLPEKINFAINYKFNPDIKKIDFRKEWFEVGEIITEIFRYIILKQFNRKDSSWQELNYLVKKDIEVKYFEDYSSFLLKIISMNNKYFRIFLSRMIASTLSILYFFRLKEEIGKFYFRAFSFRDPGLKIMSITPLIILSLNKTGEFKQEYVSLIKKILEGIYPTREINSWKEMKENYLDAYKLYYLRRFI